MEILELLKLKSAPWPSLVVSALAWFTLWAVLHDMTVTSSVGNFLLALGLPSSAASGATAVHEWLIAPPRVTWASWGSVILALAVSVRYVSAVYNQRTSLSERIDAGRQVGRTRSQTSDGWTPHETAEMFIQRQARAEADYSKAVKYHVELQGFEQGSQMQCMAVYWFIASIAIELRDRRSPDLIIAGIPSTLGVVLIIIGAAAFIAVVLVCSKQEFQDPLGIPSGADRFKYAFMDVGWEVLFLVLYFARVLLVLPMFVLGTLVKPTPSASAET